MTTALRTLLASVAVLAISATSASAQEYLTVRGGLADFDDDFESVAIGVEYQGNYFWHNLAPIAGVQVNEDGAGYIYGGLAYDFNLGESWVLTPNFAVAAYEDGDDGRDLGGVLEFRSGLELDYRFANEHRVGLAIHHLSNAGLHSINPGTEEVTLSWSIPMQIFSGGNQ